MLPADSHTLFKKIADWLRRHSTSVELVGNEMRFIHSDTCSSLLVMHAQRREGALPVRAEILRTFFDEALAASIGNGYIMIGSVAEGGVQVSHGYRIPDLGHIRRQAVELGMTDTDAIELFMMEAAWMLVYGVEQRSGRLIRFDHELGAYDSPSSIEEVLEDWWKLEVDDGRVPPIPACGD